MILKQNCVILHPKFNSYMKIAIISAMEKERNQMIPMLLDAKEFNIDGLPVWEGRINDNEILLGQCGIGKVNAAINTYRILASFHPDLLINTGVAGGASFQTDIGDILVADYVAYHDVWCGPGTQPGVADGMEVFMPCDRTVIEIAYKVLNGKRLQVGLICSGDKFISEKTEVDEIRTLFPEVIAVDMESAAIAQVCTMFQTKFNIIRVISDTPGSGRNIDQYKNFWKEAPEKTFSLIEAVLKNL